MKNRAVSRRAAFVVICGLFVVVSVGALPQDQDITTANTSRRLGKDSWEWTAFIKASDSVLRSIRCVEYRLPSTFAKSTQTVCKVGDKNQPFALKGTSWGTFDVPIKVIFKNGKTRSLRHRLIFSE